MERMERVLHRYPLLANVSPLDYNVNIKTNKLKEMRNKMNNSTLDKNLVLVCMWCTQVLNNVMCFDCKEYKGVMTMKEWEEYTNETWEA